MRTFRSALKSFIGRLVVYTLVGASIHYAAGPDTYLYALEVERAKEQQIRTIAQKLNVDPEFLLYPQGRKRFDFKGLFDSIGTALGFTAKTATANDQPLDIRESIARVKQRYALVAADTTLAKIAEALQVDTTKLKNKGQLRAHLNSVLRLIDKDFLPPVPDSVSGNAKSRDAQMRSAINKLRQDVKQVLNEKGALDEANIDATLNRLRQVVGTQLTVKKHGPRWTRDPFPVKDTYTAAPKRNLTDRPATAPTTAMVNETALKAKTAATTNAVPAEVAQLASQLATPAKIFAWVHDNIHFEPYSGVAKGSLGTLQEKRGNDWDQALLLRDLLTSRGWSAQLEWGTVTLPMSRAMNLAGTEDPTQAANLLATAGFAGVVLMAGNAPVGVQMEHAWVRAHIPYIPNRGATAGSADTWVRMDPSFKRYEYQPGIKINGKVAWNENEYLNTSAIRPPSDFYGDKIWGYIRTNNIDCVNLSQVTKAGRIKQQNYPYVPSTLTAKIDSVAGTAVDAPANQVQSVAITINQDGATVASYNTSIAATWGKKLSITFAPATADDAATIAAYGGLFNTPAYLIRLKPVFSIDDQPVAEGVGVPAGASLDLNLRYTQPNVPADTTHHDMVAGETHTLVFDAGNPPDSLIESRLNRAKTLAGNDEALLSEKLYLVGLRYMQHVDDGLAFAAGVRWQRPVKRVFEADVRRQVDVTYNFAGAPLRLRAAENNIDVARLLVGIVPIDNDLTNKAEALALAGLQSSYLEGSIWEEMHSRQGISAAKALLLARQNGQQIQTVTSANVDAVLASANLSADVEEEIRGAVAQGRIAKIAPQNVALGGWTGTGYILSDPQTGAATYPISGGLAGGAEVAADAQKALELLGSETWIYTWPYGDIIVQLLTLGGTPQSPSSAQGDPVNLTSGNMYRFESDLGVATRGTNVAVVRAYNSRSTYNGPFGYGWTWSYGDQLVANADGSVSYREGDGTEHLFRNVNGALVSPPGRYVDLTADGGGWTMTYTSGAQRQFGAHGYVIAERDPNDNVVTINRDAQGNVQNIVDDAGRTVVTFEVTGGRITKATDILGRAVSYEYDGDDLVAVTDAVGKRWTMSYDLAHNMTSHSDPLGNTQSYDYDADDRLFHHVDAVGAEEYFHYNGAGGESVITDRRGGERLVQYDERGRATLEADPAGNVIRTAYDAGNNRTAVIDSRGNTTAYEYDTNGNVTKQTNPDGGTIVSTYDAQSRQTSTTDALGTTTSYDYDGDGNLLEMRRSVGGVTEETSYTYDSDGQILTMTDPKGAETSMTWSDNGAMATRTDAAGHLTNITTDAAGRVTVVRDGAGNETKVDYDGKDRMVAVLDAYGRTTRHTYDDAGRRTAVVMPQGTITFTYDGEGRMLSQTDPQGNVTRKTYSPGGDLLTETDARGNVTRREYDAAGRVTRLIDGAGGVWSYGYCAGLGGPKGSPCETVDPNGNVLRQEYDTMGRVVARTDSMSHATFTQYDKAGRKTVVTDANGNATRFGYDEAGRLVSVIEADGSVTAYTYDKSGNKLTQKDGNGRIWSFKYDGLDRRIEETDPLGRKSSLTYDAVGNIKTQTDGNGKTTTFDYVGKRLMKATYADGSIESYTYDAFGRRKTAVSAHASMSYDYDSVNRITAVHNTTYGPNARVSYTYDVNGNRKSMTTAAGTVQYTYDPLDRLTQINDPVLGKFGFTYDAMGRRTSLSYPNGTTASYAYDKAYRLVAVTTKDVLGAVMDGWSYQYDAVGNRTSKTDMSGRAEMYRYDNVDRLTEVNYVDGSFEKFSYDRGGNRTSLTSPTGTIAYTYDVANQLVSAGTTTFTYDGNGNQLTKTDASGTTTFTYDLKNRVASIGGAAGSEVNRYSTDGRRTQITSAAVEGEIRPQYDIDGNAVLDLGNDNTIWNYRLFGPGIDEVLGEWWRVKNRTIYLHRDGLGSVTAVSNPDGKVAYTQTYRAFGKLSRGTNPTNAPVTRMGYTGRENSVGGLMQYRTRYYDPETGRFLHQDSYRGESTAPPSLHRYTYVLNNPVRYIDPFGMSPKLNSFNVMIIAVEVLITMMLVFGLMIEMSFAAPDPAGWYLLAKYCTLILVALEVAYLLFLSIRAVWLASTDPNAPPGAGWVIVNATIMAMVLLGFVAGLVGAAFGGHALLHALLGSAPTCPRGCAAVIMMLLYAMLVAVVLVTIEHAIFFAHPPEMAHRLGSDHEAVTRH